MTDVAGKERCQFEAARPPLQKGEVALDGKYFRAIQRSHLRRRYADDRQSPPLSRKLHKSFFEDLAQDSSDGVSVNCCQCHDDPRCSVAWVERDGYTCVLRVDVEILKKWLRRSDIVAVYDPMSQNCCHYLLTSEDGDIQEFISSLTDAVREFDQKFPNKLSVTAEVHEKISVLSKEFEALFELVYEGT